MSQRFSSRGICHSSFNGDIARPDESSDQPAVGIFCFGRAAHGARDSDATPKKRGLGRRIWRGGHGKHFRCANDQCAGEVYDLASWHFFRAYVWFIGVVRASRRRWRERVPARVDETASCTRKFSCAGHCSPVTRFVSSQSSSSGFSCFFPGARCATNSEAVAPAFPKATKKDDRHAVLPFFGNLKPPLRERAAKFAELLLLRHTPVTIGF